MVACSDSDPRQSISQLAGQSRDNLKNASSVVVLAFAHQIGSPMTSAPRFMCFVLCLTVKAIHKPVCQFIKNNMHTKPNELYNAAERWEREYHPWYQPTANEKHFALLAYFEGEATVSQSVSQTEAGSWNWNSISFSFQIKICLCWNLNIKLCHLFAKRPTLRSDSARWLLFIRKTDGTTKSVYKQKTCFGISERAKKPKTGHQKLSTQLATNCCNLSWHIYICIYIPMWYLLGFVYIKLN